MKKLMLCLLILSLVSSSAFGAAVYSYKIKNIERGDSNLFAVNISVFVNGSSLVDIIVSIDPEILVSFATKPERIIYIKQQITAEIERYKKNRALINEAKTFEGAEVTLP